MRIGGSKGLYLASVMKSLAHTADLLKRVEKPAGRIFEIEGKKLPATDPQSAYRVWAAITHPEYFSAQRPARMPPDVREIFDGRSFHAALLKP